MEVLMFAITPRGVGMPVGARAIRAGWPLADGETFAVDTESVDGLVLAEDGVSLRPGAADELNPPKPIDGAAFLARVTDDEYAAITASDDVQVRRWLDIFRLRGEIDVNGNTAQAAKAGLVALGLLTQARADGIFVP
jgi:hypothetical protein